MIADLNTYLAIMFITCHALIKQDLRKSNTEWRTQNFNICNII